MTKKIVIFNWRDPDDPLSGGAERVTLKHAEYWVKQGHSVTWVSGSYPGAKSKKIYHGIVFIRSGNSKTLFLRAWWIFHHDLKGEADVIIDEMHGLPMFSPLWAGDRKLIVFIHEVAQEIWNEMFTFPVNSLGRFIERYVFPFVYRDCQFWVDCESTQKDLIQFGLTHKQIAVIPCAIDPYQSDAALIKEKEFTCVFVARLVKMKGVDLAIQTFEAIVKIEPNSKLWIVGWGEHNYVMSLKKMVRDLGISNKVTFFGLVSEEKKFELLGKSHFLLHTSLREGFGLTVLEANSQQTPAAVFDISALRDLVNPNLGVIVPFGETEQLAKKMVQLYKNTEAYKEMCKAVKTYNAKFSWEKFTMQSELLL